MTTPPPAIVVTLPARTIPEARRQSQEARAAGANFAEIRFDRFSSEDLERAGELFPPPLPLIATVRSRAEGGEGPDDPTVRARLLERLARHPFRWIDVERARDFPWAESLSEPAVRGLIVSTHLAYGTSEPQWRRFLREPVLPGAVRKVVTTSSVGQLLRELLPAIPPSGESPVVAHTTGPSGPLLRAWSKRLGFPMVFASPAEGGAEPSLPPVEPSQIPVDRLRPFLAAEGNPPLFAIVGHPVVHSRSPALHGRWMRTHGHVGLFVALDFETDEEFTDSLPSLIEGGFRGLSVTHPFKEVAFEWASRTGPGAAACGVANTLSFEPDGTSAENTDLLAILRRLEELRASGLWDGSSVGVIGAGGAARATLAAARSLGVEAEVWARRSDAAEVLAREFGAHATRDPERTRPTLVVHATTVGRATPGPVAPPNLSWLRPGVHTVDWVYAADDPIVHESAERAGSTYEDGSRLLAYQAAASYGLWWGEEPTAEEVRAALEGIP